MDVKPTASIGHSNSLAHSGSQRTLPMENPMPSYHPHFVMPRPMMKHHFGGRKTVEGRGRDFVMYGILQIVIGLLCFVLALIVVSVTISGNLYSAGTVCGLVFIATGVLGCMVGSSMSDCYAMTYLVLNIASDVAAIFGIGMSGWEVNRIGSMTSVASADGYLAVKCALVIISCTVMFIICTHQARKLRDTPCCTFQREPRNDFTGQQGPLDCVVPPSNTTTNSSWNWNIQHNVNQPQNMPQNPNLPIEYLASMEATGYPLEEKQRYSHGQVSDSPFQPSDI